MYKFCQVIGRSMETNNEEGKKKKSPLRLSLDRWELFPWSITLSTVLMKETNYRETGCLSACRIDSDVFSIFLSKSNVRLDLFNPRKRMANDVNGGHLQRLAIRFCSSSFGREESIFPSLSLSFSSPVEVKFGR